MGVLVCPRVSAQVTSTGKVLTDFGNGATMDAQAVVVQRDGKIIAVGSANGCALARYNVNGSLDPTFGGSGKVVTQVAGKAVSCAAAALQSDGRIVAAGFGRTPVREPPSPYAFLVFRYLTNGALDASFGNGGIVVTDFDGDPAAGRDVAGSVAIQSDGRILAAGTGMARYNADGSLDPTFGTGGKVTTEFAGPRSNAGASAVALQSDGRIVAAGFALNAVGASGGPSDFALIRYNADGALDTTFGNGGKVQTEFSSDATDSATGVAIQGDGRIVAVGSTEPQNNPPTFVDFAIARYRTDGSLDPSFGSGGRVATDFVNSIDYASTVTIQSDGRILAAGSSEAGNVPSIFALARYGVGGALDPTF